MSTVQKLSVLISKHGASSFNVYQYQPYLQKIVHVASKSYVTESNSYSGWSSSVYLHTALVGMTASVD